MKYARIVENTAIEIFVPHDGFKIEECFHPDVLAQFSEVPDNVVEHSTRNPDGTWNIFVPPIEPEKKPVSETVQAAPHVTS
jgi:hypothetical protein